ncbi:MAG: hypothetical protein A4E67_00106 [Syntrophaceae bacterium PtaB.Bin038]|nr:MAG: hypothetical protein A4E67_00106 [Syntrophaceae bacterium PtaB.Bin038]
MERIGPLGRRHRAVRGVPVELVAETRLARGPAVDSVEVVHVVVVVRAADGVAALAGAFTGQSRDAGRQVRFAARPLLVLQTEGPGAHHVAVMNPGVGVEVVAECAGTPGAGLLVTHIKYAVEGVEGHVGALPGDVALRRNRARGGRRCGGAGGRGGRVLAPHPLQGVEAGRELEAFLHLDLELHSQAVRDVGAGAAVLQKGRIFDVGAVHVELPVGLDVRLGRGRHGEAHDQADSEETD